MTPNEIAKQAIQAALDRKAEDMTLLHVTELTTLADYYVICTGSSMTQLRAIADSVDECLSKQGIEPLRIEGYRGSGWVLIDYGSVIIHVFKKDMRMFYNIERLWADAVKVDVEQFLAE